MPIIKSAKKRVKVTKKATVRNAKTRRSLREALKAFNNAIKTGKTESITKAKSSAEQAIDKAAKKNVIHKNKAARKKQQLSKAAKASSTSKPKATKKAVTKKTTTKKPAAKK
jgi:small subunit ribosomal protein S20